MKDHDTGGACYMHGEESNTYDVLVGNNGKKPLDRPWLKLEDIKMEIK
jgi:hypothetical protein